MTLYDFLNPDGTEVEEQRVISAPGATTGDVLTVNADDTISPAPGGGSQPFTEGEGSALAGGVDAIWAFGFLTAAPAAGSLVLAVNGVHVTLPGAVVDDPVNLDAASYFATAGFTVTVAPYSGEIEGYSVTFGGDDGEKPVTFTIFSNTIVDGSNDPVALDPANPVEVQAGSVPPAPADPTVGDRYLDTLTDVIWTYTTDGWTGVGALDYVEVFADPPLTFDETPATLIEGNEIALDGQTAIVFELYIPGFTVDKGDSDNCGWNLILYDGVTEVGGIMAADLAPNFVDATSLTVNTRTPSITPAAGSHTYSVKANTDAGGSASASTDLFPIYLRTTLA